MAAVVVDSSVTAVRAADVETEDYVPSHTRRWTANQRASSLEYAVSHEVGIDAKLVKPTASTITSGASVIFEHAKVLLTPSIVRVFAISGCMYECNV